MYVRQKKNRSGSTSVVVVNKLNGTYQEIKNFGTSSDSKEIASMCDAAHHWISTYGGQQEFDFDDLKGKEIAETERVIANMDSVLINGTQLLLNRIYDKIGFCAIDDEVLRHLVIARISQPASKLATVDYLKSYYDEDVDLSRIYRYMDKLYLSHKELAQEISIEHTKRIMGGTIGLVFYDVTTLYFETSETDSLREPGFSKDGKTAESQVVLGLLVSEGGYPLSYSLFNGRQYEGFTMMPIIDDFKRRYALGDDFIVVADSGLMNKRNIALLQQGGYKFIIGARIKNEPNDIKDWILSQPKRDGGFCEMMRDKGERLIINYSKAREVKDAYNRKKGLERLRKACKNGKITKAQINNRGYNKFLELNNDVSVSISDQKIEEDSKWDGLKGYITNTDLEAERVVAQYHGLWVVERSFRVTKGTLEMRPMFHFSERRIEAHICICFIAYKVYKELERIIRTKGIGLSVDKVINIAKTITTVKVNMPHNGKTYIKTLFLTNNHLLIKPLFEDTD